jgi:hypothetical protein
VSPDEKLERCLIARPNETFKKFAIGDRLRCVCNLANERSQWGSGGHECLRINDIVNRRKTADEPKPSIFKS